MNTLKTWFCILMMAFTLPAFASVQSNKDIPLQGDCDDERNCSVGIGYPVLASIENSSLQSQFVKAIGEVSIVIADQYGKILLQESVFVSGAQGYAILLPELPKGTYKVSYLYNGKCIYGIFKID